MGDFSKALDSPAPGGGYGGYQPQQQQQQQQPSSSYGYNNNEYRPETSNATSGGAYPSTTAGSSTSTEDDAWRKEFAKYDKDGNGFITIAELKMAVPKMVPAALLKSAMGMVDKDKDGQISFDEYKQVRQKLAKLTGGGKKK
jgi:hypothetical protein